MISRKIILS